MAQDTLLGFPAHTLPYRHVKFAALSTKKRTELTKFCPNMTVFAGDQGMQRQGSSGSGAVSGFWGGASFSNMSEAVNRPFFRQLSRIP